MAYPQGRGRRGGAYIYRGAGGKPQCGKKHRIQPPDRLRQHTGNWPGKTVERAEGYFSQAGQRFRLVDLPGTYSLAADSPEEEVAGAFLQSGQADAVIVVVDASCLRRGLILALQLRQQTQRLVLCVNLMDEAARRGITPQTERLGQLLDVPVVATAARSGKGLAELRHQAAEVCRREPMGGRLETDLRPSGGGGAGTAGDGG